MSRKLAKVLSAILLVLAIVVTRIPVTDVNASDILSSDYEIEGTKLLKYTGTAEVVSVPDEIRIIGEDAFAGNDHIVSVEIAGDTREIGYRAFAGCDSLRSIHVGDSVEKIDVAAFSNDPELVNVTLGSGVKELAGGVFAGSKNLKDLSVSEDNPYLSYVNGVLYDKDETIVYALMPASEKGAFTFPSTVEEVKAYAFWGNPNLENVKLNSKIADIPAYAFSNCMNLKEVYLPLPIHTIEAKAFEDCVNLEKVTLPDSLNFVHETAFDGCGKTDFVATPGTYAGDYALSKRATEAEEIEYEETDDHTVISEEEMTETEDTESNDQEIDPPSSYQTVDGSYSSRKLLGESSIVAGKAVIFIDRNAGNQLNLATSSGDLQNVYSVISENAEKGKDFPKYTIVGTKIASQAYYQDEALTEYEFVDPITEIGNFAFARSGLTSIEIPNTVTKIGYGAFYHANDLMDVTIPNSVEEIEANAFSNTPWFVNAKQNTTSYPYLVVGDGILLAYEGNESVVNIPAGVKQIGAECFKDHMGITAVNIPDSVEVIGASAFLNCKNLKTVNGGNSIREVKDRAFQNCPLSQIRIPSTVEEIGIAAYDCPGGTDTVTFEGDSLPILTYSDLSGRLSDTAARNLTFSNCRLAVVQDDVQEFSNTILDQKLPGFVGSIVHENGSTVSENSGFAYHDLSGVEIQSFSINISDESEETMATMPGNDGNYLLQIIDSEEANAKIGTAYAEIYGGSLPSGLIAFDLSLYERNKMVPITKLGKQYMTVQIPKPEGIQNEFHVVTLDQDGQLEAVEHQLVTLENGDYIQFTARHFSPYGIYNSSSIAGSGFVQNGKTLIGFSGNKDNTPDTGDNGIHPKWIVALGLLAASVAMFFYKRKEQI